MTTGTRVLVVEDDPQMARFLRTTLTAHGHEVTVAGGVAAGATAAAQDPPQHGGTPAIGHAAEISSQPVFEPPN
jgi:CheY-like chemotaxis protein